MSMYNTAYNTLLNLTLHLNFEFDFDETITCKYSVTFKDTSLKEILFAFKIRSQFAI